LEQKIKAKVHAETAVLYEQKMTEMQQQYANRFELEIKRLQNQMSKENK
jgi:hypothetical protein